MRTGIMGYKGRVHYHCSPCIDGWLDQMATDFPKTEIFTAIAQHIDSEIHRSYRLFPNNYVALDLLEGTNKYADLYSEQERQQFIQYIEAQLKKIDDVPNRDDSFLRERMLTMYANPLRNQMAAL